MSKIYISIVIAFIGTALYGQESVVASGGEASGTGGTVSYSVGQVAFVSHTDVGGSATHGVQHAYEIFTTVSIEEAKKLTLETYPNPTNSKLILKIGDYNNEKLTYQLHDLHGKLIESRQINTNHTTINMEEMPVSTYLLNVVDDNELIKTFKIIKN